MPIQNHNEENDMRRKRLKHYHTHTTHLPDIEMNMFAAALIASLALTKIEVN